MSIKINERARILIASDQRADAESLQKLLLQTYLLTSISLESERSTEDFERERPDLILLAFNRIENAQRYYLGLYRFGSLAHSHPHRTVVLCGKDEVRKAYELCCKEYFDDYVLFWPSPYDGCRLPMSIHVALRELKAWKSGALDKGALVRHADQMGEFEKMLEERLAEGEREVAQVAETMHERGNQLDGALDKLLDQFQRGLLNQCRSPQEGKLLERELARFTLEEIRPLIASGRLAIEPLRRWASELQRDSNSQLSHTRELIQLIEHMPRRILVVDDDEFSQKIVSRLLEREGYEPVCVSTAAEAITLVGKIQPALILMDYMLPDEDGLSATRRIKGVQAFAHIPIIMLTGQRDRETVVNSLLVGASDFVGKPINPVTLMAKIKRYLSVETHS